jgi:hypothetical protein
MVGLNLLMVGAVAETHLGDAPALTASPSEGTDFAGLLETMLPTGEFWTPDGSETPRVPDADATLAQLATLGLMTLPITPMLEPATEATFPTQTPEPTMRFAGADRAYRLQESTPFPLEPTMAQGATPKFDLEPTLGDGRGESDFPKTRPAASESLLAVEGDAPPAAARQAEPPPPSPSTTALTDASALGAPSTAPAQDAPLRDDLAPTPEPLRPREESPMPAHEPRTHAPTPHAPSPTRESTLSATDAAAPRRRAELERRRAGRAAHRAHGLRNASATASRCASTRPNWGSSSCASKPQGSEVQAWLTAERDLTPPDAAARPTIPARATRIARAATDPLRCGRAEPVSLCATRTTHTLRNTHRIHTHPHGYGQPPT